MENVQLAAVKAAVADLGPQGRREALELGSTFASLTIRMTTAGAERKFEEWIADGRPEIFVGAMAAARSQRLASVRALTDAQVEQLWEAPLHEAAVLFAEWTWGYALPKANFALACAGFKGGACFDMHMLADFPEAVSAAGWERFAVKGWRSLGKAAKLEAAASYVTLSALVAGDSHPGDFQWEWWLERHGRGSTHSPLLDALREVAA